MFWLTRTLVCLTQSNSQNLRLTWIRGSLWVMCNNIKYKIVSLTFKEYRYGCDAIDQEQFNNSLVFASCQSFNINSWNLWVSGQWWGWFIGLPIKIIVSKTLRILLVNQWFVLTKRRNVLGKRALRLERNPLIRFLFE